jgi:hypothetical protein
VTLGLVTFTVLNYGFMSWYFRVQNKKRADGDEDWKYEGKTEEDVAEMGDESPRFRFTV